jgi:hypothetical protein
MNCKKITFFAQLYGNIIAKIVIIYVYFRKQIRESVENAFVPKCQDHKFSFQHQGYFLL